MSSSRSPSTTGLAWLRDDTRGRYARVVERTTDPRGLSFFAPDFALSDPAPWLIGEELAEFPRLATVPLPALTHRVDPSATDFAVTFEDITARLARGEFSKVVPIVHEDLGFAGTIDVGMFPRAWGPPPPNQLAYGFTWQDEGLCGITPETLFSMRDDVIHTMALAGTGRADGPNLLDDAKEVREHRMVIDHVVAELKRWGRADVGDTTERIFGRLKHLFTPITVKAARAPKFMELVTALHPTAALGGYPRRPAVEWLEQQNFHVARRRFGAPFGYVDGANAHCVVAIRGLQWRGPRLTIAAGCGIVKGSEVAREWRELELKRDAIRQNLDLSF